MNIEKDYYDYLISVLKKFGFVENLLYWIKILLNDQQSCVINRGFTISYFTLQKGERQGDPISAYLFMLVLEVLFELTKNNADIRRITISSRVISCTGFANDSTFFLGDFISVGIFSFQ